MELIKNKQYVLVVEGFNQNLTYHCTIIDIDTIFVTFIDRNNKKFSFRKDKIVSIEELQ